MTDSIDRLAPSRRPPGRAVMYQNWRLLTFLHWAFPPEEVRGLLPAGLELDTFEGKAYIGLVPFTMRGIRPVGLPAVCWLSNFHETNVRTYVHAGGRDPGVYFFSLDAANPVAVALARRLFHLPYHYARMTIQSLGEAISYRSERRAAGPMPPMTRIDCRILPILPKPAIVGTLDHFLIERYLLYTTRSGRLCVGQVYHTPYPIQAAEILILEETLLAASGLSRPDRVPLVHYSGGVNVEIFLLHDLAIS